MRSSSRNRLFVPDGSLSSGKTQKVASKLPSLYEQSITSSHRKPNVSMTRFLSEKALKMKSMLSMYRSDFLLIIKHYQCALNHTISVPSRSSFRTRLKCGLHKAKALKAYRNVSMHDDNGIAGGSSRSSDRM